VNIINIAKVASFPFHFIHKMGTVKLLHSKADQKAKLGGIRSVFPSCLQDMQLYAHWGIQYTATMYMPTRAVPACLFWSPRTQSAVRWQPVPYLVDAWFVLDVLCTVGVAQ